MGKDIRGTKTEEEVFEILGDLKNPTSHMFAELFAAASEQWHKNVFKRWKCYD